MEYIYFWLLVNSGVLAISSLVFYLKAESCSELMVGLLGTSTLATIFYWLLNHLY